MLFFFLLNKKKKKYTKILNERSPAKTPELLDTSDEEKEDWEYVSIETAEFPHGLPESIPTTRKLLSIIHSYEHRIDCLDAQKDEEEKKYRQLTIEKNNRHHTLNKYKITMTTKRKQEYFKARATARAVLKEYQVEMAKRTPLYSLCK